MRAAPIRTPPREQLVILLDFTGYTLFNAPPFKTSLETLKILQDCYCERLGEALLLNPPTVFRVLWKLLRPFIDPRTLKKINILPKNFECCEVLSERWVWRIGLLDLSLVVLFGSDSFAPSAGSTWTRLTHPSEAGETSPTTTRSTPR